MNSQQKIEYIRGNLIDIEAHISRGASLEVSQMLTDILSRAYLLAIVCEEEAEEDAAHQEHENYHRVGMGND